MGSIPGAFVAAVLIAMVKAFCIAAGSVEIFGAPFPLSKLTLVAEFLVMAVVLVWRPWGLFGKPQAAVRGQAALEQPLRPLPAVWRRAGWVALAALLLVAFLDGPAPYAVVLMIDVLIAVLFAASLHFLMGPAGMHSFGHAAYFGLGAYGAALCVKALGLPMEASLLLAPLLAALGAFVFGWFCVRLSGVYLAMLTLAFAQIVWSVVFQWDALTGGSNGLVGIWPAAWLAPKWAYYLLVLACTVAGGGLLVRMLHAPFGLALRACRDSAVRAAAIGLAVPRLQWAAFVVAGTVAGLAGSLFAFAKGTISPETLGVAKSVDGLVMVLLGGVQAVSGPWVGGALFTWLQDTVARQTDYWRALLGIVMLALVLAFPLGVAGGLKKLFLREREAAP
jgi:branched-chain amino acid transport system permease protein